MAENETVIKELSKFLIENGNRKFTKPEKEVLKNAVDESRNMNELLQLAAMRLPIDVNR